MSGSPSNHLLIISLYCLFFSLWLPIWRIKLHINQPPFHHSTWTKLSARSSQLSRLQPSSSATHTCTSFQRPDDQLTLRGQYTSASSSAHTVLSLSCGRPPTISHLTACHADRFLWSWPQARGVSKIHAELSAGSVINSWLSPRCWRPINQLPRQHARCSCTYAENWTV